MTDVTLRIKNLSISLEAISRINGKEASRLYLSIQTLLKGEIDEAIKEQNPIRTARSATTTLDDEIPF
jgi:hypothetical protein